MIIYIPPAMSFYFLPTHALLMMMGGVIVFAFLFFLIAYFFVDPPGR